MMENDQIYDIVIIGAGPAGLTSAIYGARANKKVLVLDGLFGSGEAGKIVNLENYPAIEKIDGYSLLSIMKKQAQDAGAQFVGRNAVSVDVDNMAVTTSKASYKTKNVILATGCKAQKLGVTGEKELIGFGISYCATCDGPLYKNKTVALVGRGKKASQDVDYLANLASVVYYITDDEVTDNRDNVVVIKGKIAHLNGNPLESVTLEDGTVIQTPILFVNIGYFPETSLIAKAVDTDEKGYVYTDENMQTTVTGVYAVGDIRVKSLRQIVTACSDGAIAAEHAVRKKIKKV